MKTDLVEQLTKIAALFTTKYRSVPIKYFDKKFHVYNKEFDTIEDARKAIDESYLSLEKSLK